MPDFEAAVALIMVPGRHEKYQTLVEQCHALGLAGATVLAGTGGAPLVIVIDSAEKIARAAPEFEHLLVGGTMACEPVRVRRIAGGARSGMLQ